MEKKVDKSALDEKANIDASNIDIDAWNTKLGVGKIEEGNTGLINGGTVYNALQNVKTNDMITFENDEIRIGGNSKYDSADTINVAKSDGSGRVITGVLVNPDDITSAVNVGYVNAIGDSIINGVNKGFHRVDDKMNKMGANAAAMASLTPATTDGDEKWALSASVGNYHSETAGAVGLFYKPSENVMVNVRGSFGNDENMIGGGVAVALDKGTMPGVTKAQMVKTINAQAQEIQTMKVNHATEMNELREKDRQRDAEMQQMRQQMAILIKQVQEQNKK